MSFIENILDEFEDLNSLLNEISYLKIYFKNEKSNEKNIAEKLFFYKKRKNISEALFSLIFILNKFIVMNDFNKETLNAITTKVEEIKNIQNIRQISEILKIKNIDEYILDKEFLDVLIILNRSEHNLFEFLESKNENEIRGLIDGFYNDDNDYNLQIRDIEVLKNAVCFIQDIKKNNKDIRVFLNNFHNLLRTKIYKEIISNLINIESKLINIQRYIEVHLGKENQNLNIINKFLQEGIIEIKKNNQLNNQEISILTSIYYPYEITIQNVAKDLTKYEDFEKYFKKTMIKNYYTYGEYGEDIEKVKIILDLIQKFFQEIIINPNENNEKSYKVSEFKFEKKWETYQY